MVSLGWAPPPDPERGFPRWDRGRGVIRWGDGGVLPALPCGAYGGALHSVGMVAYGAAKLPGTGDVVDGKYKLERLLGQGGMGAVFAARHIKLGHAVAIKLMLADAANV